MGSTIESHSSYLNNKRLQIILAKIDDCGSSATRSKHYHDIEQYFNEVTQLYINIAPILLPEGADKILKIRNAYAKVKALVENDPRYQTKQSLDFLLKCARELNLLLIEGLQNMEYFFRIGQRTKKGLKNISFFETSIFGEKNAHAGESEE